MSRLLLISFLFLSLTCYSTSVRGLIRRNRPVELYSYKGSPDSSDPTPISGMTIGQETSIKGLDQQIDQMLQHTSAPVGSGSGESATTTSTPSNEYPKPKPEHEKSVPIKLTRGQKPQGPNLITVTGTASVDVQTDELRVVILLVVKKFCKGFDPKHPMYTMAAQSSSDEELTFDLTDVTNDETVNTSGVNETVEATATATPGFAPLRVTEPTAVELASVQKSCETNIFEKTKELLEFLNYHKAKHIKSAGVKSETIFKEKDCKKNEQKKNQYGYNDYSINEYTDSSLSYSSAASSSLPDFPSDDNYSSPGSSYGEPPQQHASTSNRCWKVGVKSTHRIEFVISLKAAKSVLQGVISLGALVLQVTPVAGPSSVLFGELRALKRATFEAAKKAATVGKALAQLNNEEDEYDDKEYHSYGEEKKAKEEYCKRDKNEQHEWCQEEKKNKKKEKDFKLSLVSIECVTRGHKKHGPVYTASDLAMSGDLSDAGVSATDDGSEPVLVDESEVTPNNGTQPTNPPAAPTNNATAPAAPVDATTPPASTTAPTTTTPATTPSTAPTTAPTAPSTSTPATTTPATPPATTPAAPALPAAGSDASTPSTSTPATDAEKEKEKEKEKYKNPYYLHASGFVEEVTAECVLVVQLNGRSGKNHFGFGYGDGGY